MKQFSEVKKIGKMMIILFVFINFFAIVYASDVNEITNKTLEEILGETSIDVENLDMSQMLKAYQELTQNYSNEELAEIIQENSEELQEKGVSKEIIDTGTKLLENIDEKQLNKILTEDLDLNKIQEEIESGVQPETIIKNLNEEMTVGEKVNIGVKLLLTLNIIKNIFIIGIVLLVYQIIIRYFIFRKAGKHGFASIIPIYRDVVMLDICGLSPWLLLFVFLPIIGWLILGIVDIFTRFSLAKAFGKGVGFGFGLLLLDPIFETILAFSKKIQYEGFEE